MTRLVLKELFDRPLRLGETDSAIYGNTNSNGYSYVFAKRTESPE
jgi:hypothetical protein